MSMRKQEWGLERLGGVQHRQNWVPKECRTRKAKWPATRLQSSGFTVKTWQAPQEGELGWPARVSQVPHGSVPQKDQQGAPNISLPQDLGRGRSILEPRNF